MSFLERLLGRRYKPSSGEVAKERLRLVLAHDRAKISPALLDTLKDEIITVISRHVDIDAEGVERNLLGLIQRGAQAADLRQSARPQRTQPAQSPGWS